MANTRFLSSVCAAVMVLSVPAFAQTNVQPGDIGAGGKLNNPGSMPNAPVTMTPPEKTAAPHASMAKHPRHVTAVSAKRGATPDTAVNQLNDQSLQAARTGQSFGGTTPPSTPAPASGK